MESEVNFLVVWATAFVSSSYCYHIGKIVSNTKPVSRLLFILPVVCLFVYLPLTLSATGTVYFTTAASFSISWLANFKLLLFAFGQGPLSLPGPPQTSLLTFITITCLPVNIVNVDNNNPTKSTPLRLKPPLNYAIKVALLCVVFRAYDYRHQIHPTIMLLLHICHYYFSFELSLAATTKCAQLMLSLLLNNYDQYFVVISPFNDPHLATTLPEFWGKRWNILSSSILKMSVYDPTVRAASPFLGRKWAPIPAIFFTFVVSGLMHDLLYFHIGRVRPTWEVTWFFILHGIWVSAEIGFYKKEVSCNKKLKAVWKFLYLYEILGLGFCISTVSWLLLPQLLRYEVDVKVVAEYKQVVAFIKTLLSNFSTWDTTNCHGPIAE